MPVSHLNAEKNIVCKRKAGYFPEPNDTQKYISNISSRFEVRYAPGGERYVVSVPCKVTTEPTTFLASTAATLLDYPISAIPAIHGVMGFDKNSFTGNLFRRIFSRPRRSIGLFNTPFSNVLLPLNLLSILESILPQYQATYADHPLLIRGLVQKRFAHTFRRLRQLGFILIPYRRIFVFEFKNKSQYPRRLRRDIAELKRYQHLFSSPTEPLPQNDYEQMAKLYRQLYLGKYTHLNPAYTAAFIRHIHQERLATFSILRDTEGEITGYSCFTQEGNWMSSGMIGHDQTRTIRPAAYFCLTSCEVEISTQNEASFNMGAGASEVKIGRGAVPDYEYLAVLPPFKSMALGLRDFSRSLLSH